MLPRQAKKWLRFMNGCKGQVGFGRGGVQCLARRGLFVVGVVQNSKGSVERTRRLLANVSGESSGLWVFGYHSQ
jgi:hypothetical protein